MHVPVVGRLEEPRVDSHAAGCVPRCGSIYGEAIISLLTSDSLETRQRFVSR
jgi:hypothetical protein